jgi:DNA-binding LacI/PurR family transcriptional regulator
MVNIKDVARRAGVSVTTVSRVINNKDPVNVHTRQLVQKAMEELNYVPNQLARGMRTHRTHTIGIIIPEFINSFYHELFHYMEEECIKEGYRILVSSTRGGKEEIEHIKDLISRRIDGLVFCTYYGDRELINFLMDIEKKIPAVFLDNLGQELPVNAVYTDGCDAVKQMVLHLLEMGHRKIGFIRGLDQYNVANDRFIGYMRAMKENNLNIREDWIYEGDFHIESGYRAGKYFLEECEDSPTAIIAASDLMAIGAMNYFLSRGINIPEDMAVAGYDDISLSRLIIPSLTTVAQPMEEIVQEAVNIIIHQIRHPRTKRKKIALKGEIKVRHSTDSSKPRIFELSC